MKPRLEFSIVAGPNGAGKSRLSPFYIHGKCFDGDLLALRLRKEHPEWEERWYAGTVASELEKQKDEALAAHKPFAFETNFSNDMPLRMIEQFRDAGYKICLYYFGIDSMQRSKERVEQRASLGGHNVTNEVVEYNFTEGTRRVKESLALFDNLTFIDGLSNYGRIVALHIKSSALHETTNELPDWFTANFAEAFDGLRIQ